MSELMVVSMVLLWVLVIVLALVVFALTRQVGILYERVAPAGALQPIEGPRVGEMTEPLPVTDLAGQALTIGGPAPFATLIFFLSPTCPVCKTLVPVARSLARQEAERLRLIFASDGTDREAHEAYVKELDVRESPYVLSEGLGRTYQVSKLPFAVLIQADGSLASKGLVNTREHLESLIEAMDTGYATVQDYVRESGTLDLPKAPPVKEITP